MRLVPPPNANGHRQQIRSEQIRLLFEQLPAALIATTIVGALVVYVLWGHVSPAVAPPVAAWIGGHDSRPRMVDARVLQSEAVPFPSRVVGAPLPCRRGGLGRDMGTRRGVSAFTRRRFAGDVPALCARGPDSRRHVDPVVVPRCLCGVPSPGDPAVCGQADDSGRRSVRGHELDADPVHCDDVADLGTPLQVGHRVAPAALRQC